jgi:hypothetical protein
MHHHLLAAPAMLSCCAPTMAVLVVQGVLSYEADATQDVATEVWVLAIHPRVQYGYHRAGGVGGGLHRGPAAVGGVQEGAAYAQVACRHLPLATP